MRSEGSVSVSTVIAKTGILTLMYSFSWNPPAPLGRTLRDMPRDMSNMMFEGIPHSVTEEDAYRGYAIPADTIVIPNIWSVACYRVASSS